MDEPSWLSLIMIFKETILLESVTALFAELGVALGGSGVVTGELRDEGEAVRVAEVEVYVGEIEVVENGAAMQADNEADGAVTAGPLEACWEEGDDVTVTVDSG